MVNPKTTFSEKESSYLVLGLDIGIGSCGWCILDRAQHIIVDMGVRLWNPPQEKKDESESRVNKTGCPIVPSKLQADERQEKALL